ncbi:Transposase [Caloramator quimbayensis]|uniref:Transposase n=1 Tax=Caloramator quimbayensis TaxID=1147123 RepID=A0A1T4X9J8_9CLOT|nr:IS21 family transposase [Caloramator quimbayensis]SKA86243.1 Transposase [Caloramator quimbayensis]
MLTMTQIKNIKKLYYSKGEKISEISRETGHNYRTVVKYLKKDDYNFKLGKCDKRGRPRKIDNITFIIDRWLEEDKTAPVKQRHTAKRIYERLKSEHRDLLQVGYRTIANYVSKRKKDIYKDEEGYLPLDHPKGEAQVDFGQAVFYEKGKQIEGHYLNMTFPYSNGGYTQVFKGENQECLLEGMKKIFEYIGHVPYKIWFDNLSAAVILGKNRERNLVEQFERFALHYGFEANFCNPNSGHEKGNVENKVGYHRRNLFVPIPHFENIDEYNKELLKLSDIDMKREHYKKGEMIFKLLEEEKEFMFKLPEKEFEVGRIKTVRADKYGKAEFETNLYSTSPVYSNEEVIVKATADKVIIMNKDFKTIVSHERIYDKYKESMKWYPYLEVMAKRPKAIKYTQFFNSLPDIWKDYIESQETEGKKQSIKALMKMIEGDEAEGILNATKALEETLNNGVKDIDSLLTTYYRIKNMGKASINKINLKDNIPNINEYKTDLNIYDSLYGKGVPAI